MQLSAYGRRSLDLGVSILESLIDVTNALRGPKQSVGITTLVVNRVFIALISELLPGKLGLRIKGDAFGNGDRTALLPGGILACET